MQCWNCMWILWKQNAKKATSICLLIYSKIYFSATQDNFSFLFLVHMGVLHFLNHNIHWHSFHNSYPGSDVIWQKWISSCQQEKTIWMRDCFPLSIHFSFLNRGNLLCCFIIWTFCMASAWASTIFLWYLMLYFVPHLYPRSGARNTNVLLRGAVFRTFSVNFFTYGFPVGFGINSLFFFHLLFRNNSSCNWFLLFFSWFPYLIPFCITRDRFPCLLCHFGVFILQVYVHSDYLLMLVTFYMHSLHCSACTD